MKVHSEAAWAIASQYGSVLASETRDLAADIDRLLAERCPQWQPKGDVTDAARIVLNGIEEVATYYGKPPLEPVIEFIHRIHIERQWQPIDTAPVEPWDKVPSYYRFRCLLLIPPGHPNNPPEVCEGYGYYVAAPRSKEARILRWSDGHHQRRPKYWMPLPAPKVEP